MATDTRPNIKLPAGYDNEQAFLHEMLDNFTEDQTADFFNVEAGTEDLNFLAGNQWEPTNALKRTNAAKPVLTINRLPAFIAQVLGRRKMNETWIKIIADRGGTKAEAEIREGLIRSIQKLSNADFAYDNAMLGSTACGIGNFQLLIEYENEDVWDQVIRIGAIMDHFAVVWPRLMVDPTGKDAKRCFVIDTMPRDEFEARWPWATASDVMITRFGQDNLGTAWFTKSDVRIVQYWRMRHKKRVLALRASDGATLDITEDNSPETLASIAQRPDGSPYIREVNTPYAQRYLCSASDVLEGPYDLPINRIPVFRVPGWELRIGDTDHRWGLIRFMKDPQRLHNYWRSVIAEKIMRSPKNTWVASDIAVAGREQSWRDSGSSDDPLLIWNAESGQKPDRVSPVEIEGALIEQAATTSQDLKDVSNIHEANLGMPSNEVSGKGIEARVAVSDTGTAVYQQNLSKAIEECGRCTSDLLHIVYDTARVVQVIGRDDQASMAAINTVVPDGTKGVSITSTKYNVTAVTGKSYSTKREESADNMIGLAQAMPNIMSVSADLIVEAQDWPDADKIAKRIRQGMPPSILLPEERSPEQNQQLQAQAQAGQQGDAITQAEKSASIEKDQSTASLNNARAQNYIVQAQAIPGKLDNETMNVVSEAAHREMTSHLDAIRVATGA